jgi:DNA-directed RNA polymerase specialized sigma24 family protein
VARRRPKHPPAALTSSPPLSDPVVVAIVRRAAAALCRRGVFPWSDRPDLEQELFLHLTKVRSRFRPARGPWRGFVAAVVARRAADLARDRRARKRQPVAMSLTIDPDRDPRRRTRSPDPAESAPLALTVAAILVDAPPTLRVLAERLMDEPFSEATRTLGISRGTARGRLAQLRRRFEDAGLLDQT